MNILISLLIVCVPVVAQSINGVGSYTISNVKQVVTVADYGAKADSGTTDNTTAINNAISDAAPGAEIVFPCSAGGYYYVSGQILFKSNHSYVGSNSNTGSGCAISSNYTGTATASGAFSFVAADTVAISHLTLTCANSSSPPGTCATFGWSSSTSGGSHDYMEDLWVNGYATKALVYNMGSEEWTVIDPHFFLNGGGATYVLYISLTDDLSACSICVENSMTDVRFYGFHILDETAGTTTHWNVGISNPSTLDISFDGGYLGVQVAPGGVSHGYGFKINSVGGVQIENARVENAIAFMQLTDSFSAGVYGITSIGNTLADGSTTGGTYFCDGTVASTIVNSLFVNDRVDGSETSSFTGVQNVTALEPFTVTYTNWNSGGKLQTSSVVQATGFSTGGTTFSVSSCGTTSSVVGGATAGRFNVGSSCQNPVITMGNSASAPNGWTCRIDDLSSTSTTGVQSASTVTTAAFHFSGTPASGNTASFGCIAY